MPRRAGSIWMPVCAAGVKNWIGRAFGVSAERLHLLDGIPGWAIAGFAAANRIDVVVMGSIRRNLL